VHAGDSQLECPLRCTDDEAVGDVRAHDLQAYAPGLKFVADRVTGPNPKGVADADGDRDLELAADLAFHERVSLLGQCSNRLE
jgi:hypothetical protein